MANKKTVSSRSAGRTSTRKTGKTSKVVDPMLISKKKAEVDEDILIDESSLNYDSDEELDEMGEFDEADELYDELYDGEVGVDEYDEEIEEEDLEVDRKKPGNRTSRRGASASKRSQGRIVGDVHEVETLDEEDLFDLESEKPSRRRAKKEKKKRRVPIWGKILLGFLGVILLCVAVAGVYGYNLLSKTSETFAGNPIDFLVGADLKKDENGWSHTLIFGTSEDQLEEGHGGAMLADSIMVLSVKQDEKIAKVFSIPRDLYVKYNLAGEAPLQCFVGYQGKINVTYMCALSENDDDKKKASEYFAKKIGEITGLDIQYYAAVDWGVLVGVVDSVGGIDVEPYTDDPRGIRDNCQNINWPKGVRHLTGDEALRLARARGACYGDGPNYGLSRSNFDREINQQKIINAIKDQALSVGILADPNKVFGILDSFGNNITTNITMGEIRSYIDVITGMSGDVEQIDTVKYYTTDMIGDQSVVVPSGTSTYDYSLIRSGIANQFKKGSAAESTTSASDDDE